MSEAEKTYEWTLICNCSSFNCRYSDKGETTVIKTMDIRKLKIGTCNICNSFLEIDISKSFKKEITNKQRIC